MRNVRAFTLMEVLIAIGIFAVGMVGVAAIFPVGLHLQRATVNSLDAAQFEANAEAMVLTRGFREQAIDANGTSTSPPSSSDYGVVLRGPNTMTTAGNPSGGTNWWSLQDRSYDGGTGLLLGDRHLFWVPLFYKKDASSAWQVFLFILRGNDAGITYNIPTGASDPANPAYATPTMTRPAVPEVVQIPIVSDTVKGGDSVLTFQGGVNGFNNQPRGSGTPFVIKMGDQVIVYNNISASAITPVAMTVTHATANSITIGQVNNVNALWAAMPGVVTTTGVVASSSFVDIAGPWSEINHIGAIDTPTGVGNLDTPDNDLVW